MYVGAYDPRIARFTADGTEKMASDDVWATTWSFDDTRILVCGFDGGGDRVYILDLDTFD